MDRQEITAILASAGLRPQHQFGQNFMVDQRVLAAIADAGDLQPGDVVLEVGPGVGNLTRQLSQHVGPAGKVLAVDIDYKLMPAAQRHHAALTNVTWMNTDVLAGKHEVQPKVLEQLRQLATPSVHPGSPKTIRAVKLVSNLPYNAASPLIAELLVACWQELRRDAEPPLFFTRMAFTVQWEVGLRMNAAADSRDYGPLGILIQTMADVEIVRKIPPGCFWPPPRIHSGLVVVKPDLEKVKSVRDAVTLQKFLAGIFSHRRQTLGNALKHHFGAAWRAEWKKDLGEAGFDLLMRPENFGVAELVRLERLMAQLASRP